MIYSRQSVLQQIIPPAGGLWTLNVSPPNHLASSPVSGPTLRCYVRRVEGESWFITRFGIAGPPLSHCSSSRGHATVGLRSTSLFLLQSCDRTPRCLGISTTYPSAAGGQERSDTGRAGERDTFLEEGQLSVPTHTEPPVPCSRIVLPGFLDRV